MALFSGTLLADGTARGPVDRAIAKRLVVERVPGTTVVEGGRCGYGCNMNVLAHVATSVRLDERLPLYGWLEDKDFVYRCSSYGKIACFDGCILVHLGVASGRMSGQKLGFSQIVNPYYLWRKGSIPSLRQVLAFWARAVLGNLHGFILREADIDRLGRLHGNLLGLRNVAIGKAWPELVVDV